MRSSVQTTKNPHFDMLPESKGSSQGKEPRQFLQTKDSRVITQSDSFGNEQVASEVSTKRIRPLFTIKALCQVPFLLTLTTGT